MATANHSASGNESSLQLNNQQLAKALAAERNHNCHLKQLLNNCYQQLLAKDKEISMCKMKMRRALITAGAISQQMLSLTSDLYPENVSRDQQTSCSQQSSSLKNGQFHEEDKNASKPVDHFAEDESNNNQTDPENQSNSRSKSNNEELHKLYTLAEDDENESATVCKSKTVINQTTKSNHILTNVMDEINNTQHSTHENELVPKRLPLQEKMSLAENTFASPPILTRRSQRPLLKSDTTSKGRVTARKKSSDTVDDPPAKKVKRSNARGKRSSKTSPPKDINSIDHVNDENLATNCEVKPNEVDVEGNDLGDITEDLTFNTFLKPPSSTSTPYQQRPETRQIERFVTKRRNEKEMTEADVANRCSVRLERLSIQALLSTSQQEIVVDERDWRRRPARTSKPTGSLKEPKLNVKMRRQ